MTRLFNQNWSLERRRQLRENMTDPEKKLWNGLRQRILGTKFRRQFGIGPYIVDFYSPINKIVIEVDGDSHFSPEAIQYDAERDAYMTAMEILILRFSNEEVTKNLDGVLVRIQEYVPPPSQGGVRGGARRVRRETGS